MESLVLIVHVLAAIVIIALVLLQQGKGADAGASFGGGSGASQTVFGSQGGSSFFGKLTAFFALVFFLTSFALAYVASEQAQNISGQVDYLPTLEESDDIVGFPELDSSAPESDIPVVQ